MAAKIYSGAPHIKLPSFDYVNREKMLQDEVRYINEVKQYIIESGYKGKNVGEVIQFPVADGYAQYMVVSMKPLQLMHLPLGDGWDYQFANRLTAVDVQQKIDSGKAIKKLVINK